MEDVFDDTVSEEKIGARDVIKTTEELGKAGYRDGLEEGQDLRLQQGFNKGYVDAVDAVFKFAELRGIINGHLAFHFKNPGTLTKSQEEKLVELLERVTERETQTVRPTQSRSDILRRVVSQDLNDSGELNPDINRTETLQNDLLCDGSLNSLKDLLQEILEMS